MEIYCEPRLNQGSELWEVIVVDGEGQYLKTIECEDKQEADQIFKDNRKNNKDNLKAREMQKIQDDNTFLEMMHEDGEKAVLPMDDIFGGLSEEELNEKIEEHRKQFIKQEKVCKNEASKLLMSVAKVYFDNKVIKKEEYLKFKMQVEQRGLANLIFQLNIVREAIFSLSQEIHTGKKTPRHFEVLAGLNRVVLDIVKYQHEYLGDLEESMRKLSEDENIIGDAESTGEDSVETIDTKGTIVSTSDRKVLLRELNEIIEESNEIKTPRSRNTRLHDDDPNVVVDDREYDDNINDEADDEDSSYGLDTFEED